MKKSFKLLIASVIAVCSFGFAFTFAFINAAEETPGEDTTPDTTEITDTTDEDTEVEETTNTGLTEDDKNKINSLVDFIQSLSEEELIQYFDEVKTWVISLGIVGGISLIAAFLGLIAAIVKLRNEKIRNSQLTEQAKNEKIKKTEELYKAFEGKTDEFKMLLLEFINGLSDEEKKKVEANNTSIKERISSTLQELENKE